MSYLRYIFLFYMLQSNTVFAQIIYTSHAITEGILKGRECRLVVDNKEIGFLKYVKLPCLSWYVLFDFFINKEFRNKGYGSALFEIALQTLIKKGASKIFIQPGPFDLLKGKYLSFDNDERMTRIHKLVKWYQKYHFKRINSLFLSKLLAGLYFTMRINEHPHFIMVRTVNS